MDDVTRIYIYKGKLLSRVRQYDSQTNFSQIQYSLGILDFQQENPTY